MTRNADLSSELAKLQRALERHAPATAASLAGPARLDVLDVLRRTIGLHNVPDDLIILFGWHDGQFPAAPPFEGNRALLSLEAAIDAWRFLNDPQEDHSNPVDRNWLPLLYNGAGDYVLYDTVAHQLLDYRHDESSTSVAWPNLAAWVRAIASEVSAAAPEPHDDALLHLKRMPATFTAIVRADTSSLDSSTLRELRELLHLPLVEMKRMLAQPDAPILSVCLAETATRGTVRALVRLLHKAGCAPRVAISRNAAAQLELPAEAFLNVLPL